MFYSRCRIPDTTLYVTNWEFLFWLISVSFDFTRPQQQVLEYALDRAEVKALISFVFVKTEGKSVFPPHTRTPTERV